jgi:hypothetical protein
MLLGGCWAGCAFGGGGAGVALAAAIGGEDGEGGALGGMVMMVAMLGSYAVLFIGAFLLGILTIDMTRRLYNDESFPLFSPGASIGAIKRNPGAFVMTWIGLFVARLLGSLGVIACYIGILLTMPIGIAMSARILSQWDAVVKASAPPEEVY